MALVLRFGLLADYATVGAGGKLTIVHVFEKVFFIPELPTLAGVLVVRLEGSIVDAGPHDVMFELRDFDEVPVPESRGVVPKQHLTPIGPGLPFILQLIVALGLKVPPPGDYKFVVVVGDTVVGEVPLFVVAPDVAG